MIRRFVLVLCCSVLALTGVAGAQDPPRELWEEFPLEPTTTPGAQEGATDPAPTATPEVVREEPADRIGTGQLIVLVLSYGAVRREMLASVLRELGAAVPSSGDPIEWEAGRG